MSASQQELLPGMERPNTMDPPVLRLPQELLIRVASYLTTPELGNLRRVCKDIESRLFESFANEFFRKRQFMIEEPSLQALIDISEHPTLSKRLREVILSTHGYRSAHEPTSVAAQSLLAGGFASSSLLTSSGQARDMLVEAFSNLPNLRKVGLRDYDANGRYRDGEQAQWRSYGHSFDSTIANVSRSSDQTWAMLINALGRSGSSVSSVEVFLRYHRLTDSAFEVAYGHMLKTVTPMLKQLRTLMLSLAFQGDCGPTRNTTPPSDVRLKKFLHLASGLERLRLNFDNSQTGFLKWLAQQPAATAAVGDFAASPPLPNLTSLDLGMVKVKSGILLQILGRFTLKNVNLWRIALLVDSSAAIHEDPNPAAKFFDKLANMPSLTNVQSIGLGHLRVNGLDDSWRYSYLMDFSSKTQDEKAEKQKYRKPEQRTVTLRFGPTADFATLVQDLSKRVSLDRDSAGGGYSTSEGDSDSDDSDDSDSDHSDSDHSDSDHSDSEEG